MTTQHTASSTVWPDRAGIAASTLCVVHCLLTPVLLSGSAVLAHFLPSDEHVHRTLAVAVALLGALALARGYRVHRKRRILPLMGAGLAAISCGALFGDRLPAHWVEVAVTALGSLLMITAHRLNHTFCRNCACATTDEDCCCSAAAGEAGESAGRLRVCASDTHDHSPLQHPQR